MPNPIPEASASAPADDRLRIVRDCYRVHGDRISRVEVYFGWDVE